MLEIVAGGFVFAARFEDDAPETAAAFRRLLPLESKIIHVRWSGEAVWVPLGDDDYAVGFENNTSHPAPGHVIFYPGGLSETELLIAYGPVSFASKAGPLSGNHFATLTDGLEHLHPLGRKTLLEGAQDIRFEIG